MKISQQIDKRLEEIYEKFRKDAKDLTGWDLTQELKKESEGNNFLSSYLNYRIFEIAWTKKEIITAFNLLKNLIISPWREDQILIEVGEDKTGLEEIFEGIYLKKGISLKVLDKLKLKETKNFLINFLMLKNNEINPKIYLGEKMIQQYKENGEESFFSKLIKIFEEEYSSIFGENLKKIPKIIKT
jgi:hypothetical protein